MKFILHLKTAAKKIRLNPAKPFDLIFGAALAVLLFPAPAQAYLDPGTGNIFIYVIGTLLAAALYTLKSFGYGLLRLLRPGSAPRANKNKFDELVIFSEGKAYWPTFKPIVEALLDRGQAFRYLSLDIEDPGLTLENPLIKNRYIGNGGAAFAKVGAVRARLLLSTTPNIGTPGYPIPRPKHVACLAHVCHGVGGIDTYHKHSVDSCDAVILMSECFEPAIRKLERLRNLPAKELPGLGLPYFDELKKKADKIKARSEASAKPVILIAPSWGAKGCLALAAEKLIPELLAAGYEVILRPHPQSRQNEAELLAAIDDAFGAHDNFKMDLAIDGTESLSKADLMISDKSGVRFDFAFLYEKPVLTIYSPLPGDDYEAADLGGAWEDEASARLGPVAAADELADIKPLVEQALSLGPADMSEFRESCLRNFGHSGQAIAQWLIEKCRCLAEPPKAAPKSGG